MVKLQAVELSKSYRGRKVVDGVSLEIGQGEIVGLLGPNGAGKTTTFYILVGLTRPDVGQVVLNGEDITAHPRFRGARGGDWRLLGRSCCSRPLCCWMSRFPGSTP